MSPETIKALEDGYNYLKGEMEHVNGVLAVKELQCVAWKGRAETAEAKLAEAVSELKLIATQDHWEMVLDPTWAKRIAISALAKLKDGE